MTSDWFTWVLVDANRLVIAGGLLGLVVFLLVLFVITDIFIVETIQPFYYVFGGLISGNLTLLTIIVSINQLVLSRQFKSPGQIREQIRTVADFREHVSESVGDGVPPVLPPRFMRLLLTGTRQELASLRKALSETEDLKVQHACARFADQLEAETDTMELLLSHPDEKPIHVLATALNRDIGYEIYNLERLRNAVVANSHSDVDEALGRLIENLQQIDVAREYFKTLYLQNELAYLSRILLYVGIPAEICLILTLAFFAAPTDATFAVRNPLPLVILAITAGVAPLAVLFSFGLRVATVAERTVAILPFTTPDRVP